MMRRILGGKVDWDGQHCRFCRFSLLCRGVVRSIAAFKPVCTTWQLDIWRYGWQKRQDRGKKWQRCGKVGGKNGKDVMDLGHVAAISKPRRWRLPARASGVCGALCGCSGASGAR
jgi:hypothetical protein